MDYNIFLIQDDSWKYDKTVHWFGSVFEYTFTKSESSKEI